MLLFKTAVVAICLALCRCQLPEEIVHDAQVLIDDTRYTVELASTRQIDWHKEKQLYLILEKADQLEKLVKTNSAGSATEKPQDEIQELMIQVMARLAELTQKVEHIKEQITQNSQQNDQIRAYLEVHNQSVKRHQGEHESLGTKARPAKKLRESLPQGSNLRQQQTMTVDQSGFQRQWASSYFQNKPIVENARELREPLVLTHQQGQDDVSS